MKSISALLILFTLLMPRLCFAQSDPMENQYAMVFFFRSTCSWCHQFAPTLTRFTQKNHLFTYAFSLDGIGMPGYEVPIPNTPEISQLFFNQPRSITVPATFLINVSTQKFVKVSIGAVSETDLQQTFDGLMHDPLVMASLQ
jgi:type-F conjugative transfer system pilin assembly thiol-disulfide isomerase TrbB